MFSFVTRTWNPVVGCEHYCDYCWARKLAETKLKNTERYKAGFKPRLIEKELARRFKPGEFVFVCVAPDTKVLSWDGSYVELSEMRVGDMIVGYVPTLGLVPSVVVKKWAIKAPSIRLITEKGDIICSPSHRFLTPRGYVPAVRLKYGDKILYSYARWRRILDTRRNPLLDREISYASGKRDSPTIRKTHRISISDGKKTGVSREIGEEEVVGQDKKMRRGSFEVTRNNYCISCWFDRWGRHDIFQEDAEGLLASHSGDNEHRFYVGVLATPNLLAETHGDKEQSREEVSQGMSNRIWHRTILETPGTLPGCQETTSHIGVEIYRVAEKATLEGETYTRNVRDYSRRENAKFSWCRVRGIETESEREILFDITTTTGNYITEGLISHNCDMGDLFGDWVPDSWILKVFEAIEHNSESQFLLLTKNPKRYLQFESDIPWNCICGATIETNRAFATWLSYAPEPYERWKAMRDLDWGYKFICMEPIMDFDLPVMFNWIASIAPDLWGIAIGYDNYNNNLPEPPLAKTKRLIELLKKLNYHFQLEIKTLREGE